MEYRSENKMEADRIKWNKRFESKESFLRERPSPFLVQEIERIKTLAPGLDAADIACGEGRNSVYLAQHGFRVVGLDISDAGLAKAGNRAQAKGVDVDFRRVDLDDYTFERTFDLILNFNFLLRNLIPSEVESLNPGGLLLFDTMMASDLLLQSHTPDYMLQPGELRSTFEKFNGDILFSEEICCGEAPTARLLFRKHRIYA